MLEIGKVRNLKIQFNGVVNFEPVITTGILEDSWFIATAVSKEKTEYKCHISVLYSVSAEFEAECKMFMENLESEKQGYYMVESLNKSNTRIGLVWHNTKDTRYGNETVSKEVVDVIKLPRIVAEWLTPLDFENIAKRLKDDNNVSECFVNLETV